MYTNEHLKHPLEIRVEILEKYLDEAINIICAKVSPGCAGGLVDEWITEAMSVLDNDYAQPE